MLFSTSIAENIAYARPDATEEEIVAAARAANAHDFITGARRTVTTTVVGERGMRLSGGERQRVSLARAFLKDAPILILDEPTSSVDVRTEAAIIDAMQRLMRRPDDVHDRPPARHARVVRPAVRARSRRHQAPRRQTHARRLAPRVGPSGRRGRSVSVGPLVVLGTLASNPYAGMAWMHMQIVAGLRRLGRDAYYFETTSSWPYDPERDAKVCDSDYAVPYLDRVARSFGLDGCWAYRRSYLDGEWLGHAARARRVAARGRRRRLQRRRRDVDLGGRDRDRRRLVYFGTDPVLPRGRVRRATRTACGLARPPRRRPSPTARTSARPPRRCRRCRSSPRGRGSRCCSTSGGTAAPTRDVFTTVGNWRQDGPEVVLDGETYYWSKDREFRKIIDVPRRTNQPIELATNLAPAEVDRPQRRTRTCARSASRIATGCCSRSNGWALRDSLSLTTSPWPYRDYVRSSRAELTVARDLNVRLEERLVQRAERLLPRRRAARVAQDTGFGEVLPVGEGLFAFEDADGALAAIEEINGDYERHSRAAARIAEEYFAAERVLGKLLDGPRAVNARARTSSSTPTTSATRRASTAASSRRTSAGS